MSLLDWRRILFPPPNHPPIPNLRAGNDSLYFESLTRGDFCVGSPGTGKTEKKGRDYLELAIENEKSYQAGRSERNAIFILDASGSLTEVLIRLVYQQPEPMRSWLIDRLVLDILGHPQFVVTFPFFHPDYGLNYEDQVQRVTINYQILFSEMMERTPIMSLSLRETFPQLLRLLTAMQNEFGDPTPITEAKNLILDTKNLRKAAKKHGHLVKEAQRYFLDDYLPNLTDYERERRSMALRSALGNIAARNVRPRVGGQTPAWTPKEADEKGLIVLVSGEEVINQESTQALLFTDVFSQILAHINRRTPHDPKNKPILLAIDEVPMLLQIKGMSSQIGQISPRYRSRNLMISVIFQALWQLHDDLKDQIWSLGNVTCFRVDDFNEAYTISQQLFKYDPAIVKLPPTHDSGHPILESDRGGYLIAANWIQHLDHRECVMKKYISESKEEDYVSYIDKTTGNPVGFSDEVLREIKENLLKKRATPIKDALKLVNQKVEIKRPTVS